MMCYKGKTFCCWATTCANIECPRWLNTEEAQKKDLLVAVADFRTKNCGFIPTEPKNNH